MQHTSETNPTVTCGKCNREYCRQHANAHVGETCAAYEKRTARASRAALVAMRKTGDAPKQCPGCKTYTTRMSGCAHMKCTVCKTNWCWKCGQKVDGGEFPAHYSSANFLSPCAGAQFSNGDGNCCSRAVGRITGLFTLLIFGPPALLIVLAMCLILPCIPFFSIRDSLRRRQPWWRGLYEQWIGATNQMATTVFCLVVVVLALPLGLLALVLYFIPVAIWRLVWNSCCCCMNKNAGKGKVSAGAKKGPAKAAAAPARKATAAKPASGAGGGAAKAAGANTTPTAAGGKASASSAPAAAAVTVKPVAAPASSSSASPLNPAPVPAAVVVAVSAPAPTAASSAAPGGSAVGSSSSGGEGAVVGMAVTLDP